MEKVLLFNLGPHSYALEVINLQEIVESPRLFFIPGAPECFSGAINFHGNVVPVLALGRYLNLSGGGEADPRVLVLPDHLCPLGLSVTKVRRIVTGVGKQEEAYRETGASDLFIRARFEWEGEMINVLDVARLVASMEKIPFGRS